jgi:hypothetical protein
LRPPAGLGVSRLCHTGARRADKAQRTQKPRRTAASTGLHEQSVVGCSGDSVTRVDAVGDEGTPQVKSRSLHNELVGARRDPWASGVPGMETLRGNRRPEPAFEVPDTNSGSRRRQRRCRRLRARRRACAMVVPDVRHVLLRGTTGPVGISSTTSLPSCTTACAAAAPKATSGCSRTERPKPSRAQSAEALTPTTIGP